MRIVRTEQRHSLTGLFNTSGLIVLTFYTSIALATFTAFNCFEADDGVYFSASYEGVECWREEHGRMVGVAAALLGSPLPEGLSELEEEWAGPTDPAHT